MSGRRGSFTGRNKSFGREHRDLFAQWVEVGVYEVRQTITGYPMLGEIVRNDDVAAGDVQRFEARIPTGGGGYTPRWFARLPEAIDAFAGNAEAGIWAYGEYYRLHPEAYR